jgi:hypothetical protein
MAVPNTGEISLGKIRRELESTSTSNAYHIGPYTSAETSLSASETGVYDTINTGSSTTPDGVGPFSMSEWRGYNHNAGWSIAWSEEFRSMPNNYLLLSGSKSAENTAPTNTVADQQIVSFTITNPSSTTITKPGGGSWDNTDPPPEPRANNVYVYISHGHANSGVGTYVDSGSVSIALGWGTDPGTSGVEVGIDGKTEGSNWILTGRKAGTDPADGDFLDVSTTLGGNDPPWMLNVARVQYNPSPGSASFYVRMAYSGSGDNTYGAATGGNIGVPGTYHSRSIHVINGPYSSSQDFKTTIVS